MRFTRGIRLYVILVGVVVSLVAALAAAPIYGGGGQGAAGNVVPDSYIVVLNPNVSADDVASQHGVAKKFNYSRVFNGFSGKVPPGRLKALKNDPRVISVSPNRIVTAAPKPDKPGNGNGKKNKAPSVSIDSPADGSTFSSGASVTFEGTAIDDKDGDVSDSITWDSSINGPLGPGKIITVPLNDGVHTVTASATDSGGKTGTDTISITVGTPQPPDNQTVPSGVQRIGAAPGSLSYTGVGVGVAIFDTGFDFGHSDLAASPVFFDAFGGNGSDQDGHGTFVAGVVAALDNLGDTVGVAPGATPYAVKVLTPQAGCPSACGSDADIIGGLEWVAANANLVSPPIRVANMSLGRPGSLNDNPALRAAFQSVAALDISIAVSAGNDPDLEVSQQVPAIYPEVMAVGSTTAETGNKHRWCGPIQADTASYFTTDGQEVAISAPGERRETVNVRGQLCFITSEGVLSLAMGGGTSRGSGTSFSSPLLAGVLALMWDKADDTSGGTLDLNDARAWVGQSADRIGTAPLNSPTGSYTYDGTREGILNAPGALALVP